MFKFIKDFFSRLESKVDDIDKVLEVSDTEIVKELEEKTFNIYGHHTLDTSKKYIFISVDDDEFVSTMLLQPVFNKVFEQYKKITNVDSDTLFHKEIIHGSGCCPIFLNVIKDSEIMKYDKIFILLDLSLGYNISIKGTKETIDGVDLACVAKNLLKDKLVLHFMSAHYIKSAASTILDFSRKFKKHFGRNIEEHFISKSSDSIEEDILRFLKVGQVG